MYFYSVTIVCIFSPPLHPMPASPPPSPTPTLPLDFVLVSFIVAPIDPSPHYPLWLFFSNPSLSVFVGFLFWCGSLEGSMCAGHVFLYVQLFYVFWFGHLIQLYLRLLLIGTYSLPCYPLCICVPHCLTIFPLLVAVPLPYLSVLVL